MKVNDKTATIERPQQQRPSVRWEYRSKLMDRDAELDQYGSEGWECYSVIPAAGDQAWFYFRRRVS